MLLNFTLYFIFISTIYCFYLIFNLILIKQVHDKLILDRFIFLIVYDKRQLKNFKVSNISKISNIKQNIKFRKLEISKEFYIGTYENLNNNNNNKLYRTNQRKISNLQSEKMNPFEKLKLTIDRVGLEFIPSNDYPNATGQTVYKFPKSNSQSKYEQPNHQFQQNQSAPYFKTQGPNQTSFKQRSIHFMNDEIQELKLVYQNQQKNLIEQINSLNNKIQLLSQSLEYKSNENDHLKDQISSQQRQIHELNMIVMDLQQKNANKLSQSGVMDRQRKLRQQIDRINMTVTQLAKDLNTQRSTRKNLQRQLQSTKSTLEQSQKSALKQKQQLSNQLQLLNLQLQKRSQLLEHSIKSSRDQKVQYRQQLSEIKQKHELKLNEVNKQYFQLKQQKYQLKNTLIQKKFNIEQLVKDNSQLESKVMQLQRKLQANVQQLQSYKYNVQQLNQQRKSLKLQSAYLNQQLQQEKSNIKVKVIEIKDQSLEMQLLMYKQQCRQLLKQKSIVQSIKNRSQYTIVEQNQLILNSRIKGSNY